MSTGYKGSYNFTCRGHKFEIGQTYELKEKPIICQYGFHYCQNAIDVLKYYPIAHEFRLLEIEDLSKNTKTENNKSVTNKIRIIREIPKEEYYQLFGIVNNQLKITDEFGWTKYTYDERNNQISFKNSNGFSIRYEYDKNNKQIYSENSRGEWVKHEYDQFGRKKHSKFSDGNYASYYYNSDGKLIESFNSRFSHIKV